MSAKEHTKVNGKKNETEYDPPLTLSEVGRMCGKHPTTIKRWVMDGLLNAIRLPSGLPGIRKSEVEKFLGASALAPVKGS